MHDDDRTIGRLLARREVLALLGASAGAATLAAWAPARRALRTVASGALPSAALAGTPSCVVRPEQTEGPYFVDEGLNRSDIRSDPSDGSVRAGVPLALTIAVSRLAGASCLPFAGVLVDIWHCDADGVYSDVRDPSFDTRGKKYLRGYQVTDAGGAARFVTIYPGWYAGRTVHIHFKLRTDPDADGLEFTSQLYLDDALTDAVYTRQPYAARGPRTVRNAGDAIYRGGGSQLLLAPADDGAGGYAATFAIGVEADVTTTTTTLAGGTCTTIATCLAALEGALPDPAGAARGKARRTARRLRQRVAVIAETLDRAAASTGLRRARRYAKVRTELARLVAAGRRADVRGTLGVPLATFEAAASALLGQLPPA